MPINILLLEDRYDDAEIIQAELQFADLEFNCITVKTKKDYLEQLNSKVDVILADYSLPNFNALQALEILKSHTHLDIPFIIVSSYISNEVAVECMKKGAADYFLKDRLTRLGHAVQQAHNEKKLREQARRLEQSEKEQRDFVFALSETVRTISTSLDLDTVMNGILDNVGKVVPHKVANIMLIEGQLLRFAYLRGYTPSNEALLADYAFSINHPLLRAMLETGSPRLILDTTQEPEWTFIEGVEWIRSTVSVPIRSHDVTIGFLNLDSDHANAFKLTHAEWLLAFAREAAIAVENAQLYQQVSQHASELETRVEERTKELLELKQGVEAILNSTSDAIILLQDELYIDQANPAFYQMLGYSEQQTIGHSLEQFCDRASFDDWLQAIQTLRQYKSPIRIDIVAQCSDDSLFDAEVALSLVNHDRNSLIICSLRDISQRKQIQKELQKALEQERELRALKSQFVAIVSHEFRNPLSIVQMSASTLELYMDKLDEAQKVRHFNNITTQVDHMTKLLEDVLAIETIESDKARLNLVLTNLAELCEEIISSLGNMAGKTYDIIYSYQGIGLENVILDPKLIRQVITNLISNAIKYSPNIGTIYVDLISDGNMIKLRVKDEGIGIPEKDHDRLFQPFTRAGNTGNIPGTGLGLMIIRNAVELHGGSIIFDSIVDVGTTFTVTLPLSTITEGV